jgi:hypothetical protein
MLNANTFQLCKSKLPQFQDYNAQLDYIYF